MDKDEFLAANRNPICEAVADEMEEQLSVVWAFYDAIGSKLMEGLEGIGWRHLNDVTLMDDGKLYEFKAHEKPSEEVFRLMFPKGRLTLPKEQYGSHSSPTVG